MISKRPHVIVVGAGIVGASLTYHLSRQNACVTLLDKAPKPANNVTEKSFAWINAAQDTSETYLHLRQQAIADWHRVEDELKGRLTVDWSGALTWCEEETDTVRMAHKLINSGCRVRLVNKQELCLLEPDLKEAPHQAMFAKNEGAIDAVLTTKLFMQAAREWGADVQLGNEVLSFITNGFRVTGLVTANGNLAADVVVLAAGANTAELCKPLGLRLPVNTSQAILLSFHNNRRFVNRIVSNPFMEVRAASNTMTLAAEDYIDESVENNPQAIAQRTLEKIKKHWQGVDKIKLMNVGVGRRPMPQNAMPVIGRTRHIDGLYLSVMHSGVTLAAIAGRLAAAEIVSAQDSVLLSSYRPGRFAAPANSK